MRLNELKKIASKYGATIEKSDYDSYSHGWEISAIAPDGKCWSGDGQIIVAFVFNYDDVSANREEAYEDLAERMSYGLEDYNEDEF